ncbi:MAG: hypothetical protein KC620_16680, partial [Myxococcales bacterium]|nr:hypothetical protein [Myxococcales bacterium]
AACWPDEPIGASTRHRLHSTLHNVRGLGLRALIETVDDGWRLRPDVPTFYVLEAQARRSASRGEGSTAG